MIHDYFSKVQKKLEAMRWLIIEQSINFDFISDEMGIITGKLVFIDNSIFEFMELVSEQEAEYRFHYMDKNKDLIVRWDSAPHYREIKTFPYHMHKKKGVKESKKVNFVEIIEVITEKVIGNLKL